MKTERPEWVNPGVEIDGRRSITRKWVYQSEFDDWFDKHIEPVNKMLEEGVWVRGPLWELEPNQDVTKNKYILRPDQKGFLINKKYIDASVQDRLELAVKKLVKTLELHCKFFELKEGAKINEELMLELSTFGQAEETLREVKELLSE